MEYLKDHQNHNVRFVNDLVDDDSTDGYEDYPPK